VGVYNYSVHLARQQQGVNHYLPNKGRSQPFQLNDSQKGVMPELKVGSSTTIKGQYANTHINYVLPIGSGVPQKGNNALYKRGRREPKGASGGGADEAAGHEPATDS
jgi:hypothetical protein